MYCQNCGKEIRAGVKFCPYCGHPVEPPSGKNPENRPVRPENQPIRPDRRQARPGSKPSGQGKPAGQSASSGSAPLGQTGPQIDSWAGAGNRPDRVPPQRGGHKERGSGSTSGSVGHSASRKGSRAVEILLWVLIVVLAVGIGIEGYILFSIRDVPGKKQSAAPVESGTMQEEQAGALQEELPEGPAFL